MMARGSRTYRNAIQAHIEVAVAVSCQVVMNAIQQRRLSGGVKSRSTCVGDCQLQRSCGVLRVVPLSWCQADILILSLGD